MILVYVFSGHLALPALILCFTTNLKETSVAGSGVNVYYRPWIHEIPVNWVGVSPRNAYKRSPGQSASTLESGRHFRPDTISTIAETLGAINTVGRYLVNMTRGRGETYNKITEDVPSAIYTISKNVLGKNVTDTIAPLVREALPVIQEEPEPDRLEVEESKNPRDCTTPDGASG